ncbi:MAG TPA: hypothetical protein DCY79_02265 [Planctomycetaceae bacterium]|nr:hypothetical protein [Blastopirellula sp.]HAY78613.1 hypothetical protein [Planctomycetaceae bacterium]|tara:strand:+ start:590 stop:784 length:195 start_codon:yes stop_codon:yes gene_type:complete
MSLASKLRLDLSSLQAERLMSNGAHEVLAVCCTTPAHHPILPTKIIGFSINLLAFLHGFDINLA